jgi:hypothetical protein
MLSLAVNLLDQEQQGSGMLGTRLEMVIWALEPCAGITRCVWDWRIAWFRMFSKFILI